MSNTQRIENAVKWIDNLLVTRKKQCQDMLGDSKHGYCCLGVGTELLGLPYSWDDVEADGLVGVVGLFDHVGEFRDVKREYRGSETYNDTLCLSELNDDARFTFNQIAKRIIDRPHCYFKPAVAKGIAKHYAEK